MTTSGSEELTIVIASKNRPADVRRALLSIECQTVAPAAVIVIDQSPQAYDLTGFAQVTHVHDTSISGLSVARNRAIDMLTTPRVLFIDDDVTLPPGAIAALQQAFDAHPDAIGFQCEDLEQHPVGRLHFVIDSLFEYRFFAKKRIKRGNDIEVTYLGGFGMAFRCSVFAHERFDEGLIGYSYGEDWDFSKRASRYGRLLVAQGAEVHHYWSPVNRGSAKANCRMRWINYKYFVEKYGVNQSRVGQLDYTWWKVGEAYRWLRAGLGLPSDRKAHLRP